MKAAVYFDGKLEVRDVPKPSPKPDEALIKIATAGICHSDVHYVRGHWPRFNVPYAVTMGHEGIGIVEEVGAEANKFVKTGDRVILGLGGAGGYWCGTCEYCLSGRTRLCAETRVVVGAYAEYISLWAKSLVKIPDEIKDSDVPLACAGLTGYSAVKKLLKFGVIPGKPVAIIGAAGGLGHYALQVAKVFGYTVVGVDLGQEKLDFIKSLGADYAVDASEASRFIIDKFRGVSAAIVFATGLEGFKLGLKIMKKAGVFVSVGMPAKAEGEMSISPLDIVNREYIVVASAVGTIEEMKELIQLAAQGKVKTRISRSINLSQISQVFDELEKNAYTGRAIITDLLQ
jgi:propanol-preferring alcohol dehydrogenase